MGMRMGNFDPIFSACHESNGIQTELLRCTKSKTGIQIRSRIEFQHKIMIGGIVTE